MAAVRKAVDLEDSVSLMMAVCLWGLSISDKSFAQNKGMWFLF